MGFNDHTLAVILAAGKGTRMKSDLPKVLHKVCGQPMITRVVKALKNAGCEEPLLIISEDIKPRLVDELALKPNQYCIQENRLGTGDAVAAAATAIQGVRVPTFAAGRWRGESKLACPHSILICAGDTPALDASEIRNFIEYARSSDADLAVLGVVTPEPYGYGRLVTDGDDKLVKIVEEKDADEKIKQINLINTGVIWARTKPLFECLAKINNDNKQKEYYLTDIFQIARIDALSVQVYQSRNHKSFLGINDPEQLKQMEAWLRSQPN